MHDMNDITQHIYMYVCRCTKKCKSMFLIAEPCLSQPCSLVNHVDRSHHACVPVGGRIERTHFACTCKRNFLWAAALTRCVPLACSDIDRTDTCMLAHTKGCSVVCISLLCFTTQLRLTLKLKCSHISEAH